MNRTAAPATATPGTLPSPARALSMMLLPTILLFIIIFGYIAAHGGTVDDRAIRSALPYLIAANHTLVFLVLLWVLRSEGRSLRDIGWHVPGGTRGLWREAAVGISAALLLYLFKELIWDSATMLAAGDRPTFTSLFRFRFVAAELPLMIVASTFIAVEESVYRGYGLPPLLARWRGGWALLTMAALFGLLHLGNGPLAVLHAGILGLGFAALFLWRRSLVVPVIAHGLYNVMNILT